MDNIKILFIEDNLETAQIVCEYFEDNNYDLTHCDTLTTGISYLDTEKFDILLLDLNLPDGYGLEVFKNNAHRSKVPTIVVSAYSDIEKKLEAFNLGVEDYLSKPYDLQELEARIKRILRNKEYNSNAISNKEDKQDVFYKENKIIFFHNAPLELTKMEFLILETLIENRNSIVYREFLLDKFNLSQDSRSIDYHIKNIRLKIDDHKKEPKYLFSQYGTGYKLIF